MTTINTLPRELLAAVFNSTDSVTDLAQCRLVTKRWNEPATRAMFGKKITIKSEKQALKLYRDLYRYTSRLQLLKHLHFELNGNDLPFVIEELLHLTFTPSIQRLTGSVKADKFFTTLFDIADQSTSKFDQLQDLSDSIGANQVIKDQRQVKFGSIHKSFTLRIVETSNVTSTVTWSDYFHTFRNLTTFTLKGIPFGLDSIERQIKGCHYLTTLNLKDIDYGGQTMARMTTEQVKTWAASDVTNEESLKTLNIEALCTPELIEYLTFKYPNVANITLKGQLWHPTNDYEVAQANLKRVLEALKGIRQKKLELILPPTIIFTNVVKVLGDINSNAITLTIKQIDGRNQLEMKIN